MARGVALSDDMRQSIVNAHKRGISARKISATHSVPKSTVQGIINLYKKTGRTAQSKKTGRPSQISRLNQHALKRIVNANRRSSAKEITVLWRQAIGKEISVSTTKRSLRKLGYRFYKAKEKPLLTKRQKINRLRWARERRNWTLQQWHQVIWSDESKFEICLGDTRKRVLRTSQETYHPDCLVRKVKFPASLMIWGCMSGRGVGKLHFIDGTVNAEMYKQILTDSLLPSIPTCQATDGQYIFQQDGAACHTAKTVKVWFTEHNIPVIEWPSSSPDLSPIETLWHKMKKELRRHPARSVNDLRTKLQQIWDSTLPEECAKLVDTMPARIQAVIVNKGDVTQF